jgi:hypothetical protein
LSGQILRYGQVGQTHDGEADANGETHGGHLERRQNRVDRDQMIGSAFAITIIVESGEPIVTPLFTMNYRRIKKNTACSTRPAGDQP